MVVLIARVVAISWAAPLIRLAAPAPALTIAALRLAFAVPPMAAIAAVRAATRGGGDLRRLRGRE